jgi:hypothetical protein
MRQDSQNRPRAERCLLACRTDEASEPPLGRDSEKSSAFTGVARVEVDDADLVLCLRGYFVGFLCLRFSSRSLFRSGRVPVHVLLAG